MKKAVSIILIVLLAAACAGCTGDSGMEDRIAALEEQMVILQERIDALEAENEALRIDNVGTVTFDSQTGSAELRLNDWYAEDEKLIVDLFIRIENISQGSQPDVRLLLHQGDRSHELAVEVYPGEAEGSYEAETGEISFDLSELNPDDELELELVAVFSDGEELRTGGIGWYQEDGRLYQIAG